MAHEVTNETVYHTGSVSGKRRLNSQPVGSGSALGGGSYTKSEVLNRTRDTSPNPNFLTRIQKGEIVIGPYSTSGSRILSYDSASGRVSYTAGASYTDDITITTAPVITRAALISALGSFNINLNDNKVLASTSAQARMLEGAAQTAVAFVERYKTLSLLTTSANRLVQTLRSARQSIRRGTALKDIRSFMNEASFDDAMNLWMEYRYGWRPLLYDVATHQQALANIMSDSGQYWKSKASSDYSVAKVVSNATLGDSLYEPHAGGFYAKGTARAYPRRVGAFAGFFYQVDQSAVNSSLYWLGFQSPTAVIWELVPYSFVVDWFANIGDYLTVVSSFPTFIRNAQGYLSSSQNWVISGNTESYYRGAYVPIYDDVSMPGASWELYNFSRELISPGSYVGFRFDVNVDLAKAIDLFALVRNLMGSNRSDAFSKIRTSGIAL